MGSQRLGHEMSQGIMSNVPIRAALRTLDGNDSRAVLGIDEAKWLPVNRWCGLFAGRGPGVVDPVSDRVRVGHIYAAAAGGRLGGARAVGVCAAAGVPGDGDGAGAAAGGTAGEGRRGGTAGGDRRGWARRCATSRWPPSRCWSRPGPAGSANVVAAVGPLAVDELVRRLRGKPWHVDYGKNPGLVFPVGVEDRPFQHAQRVYALNMLGRELRCGGGRELGQDGGDDHDDHRGGADVRPAAHPVLRAEFQRSGDQRVSPDCRTSRLSRVAVISSASPARWRSWRR